MKLANQIKDLAKFTNWVERGNPNAKKDMADHNCTLSSGKF